MVSNLQIIAFKPPNKTMESILLLISTPYLSQCHEMSLSSWCSCVGGKERVCSPSSPDQLLNRPVTEQQRVDRQQLFSTDLDFTPKRFNETKKGMPNLTHWGYAVSNKLSKAVVYVIFPNLHSNAEKKILLWPNFHRPGKETQRCWEIYMKTC